MKVGMIKDPIIQFVDSVIKNVYHAKHNKLNV